MSAQRTRKWRGEVLLWEEHGLFLGDAGDAELHESPAIKICLSRDVPFGLTDHAGRTTDFLAAAIPAGVAHAIDGRGVHMAMLLLAPEGELGSRLSGLATEDRIVALAEPRGINLPDNKMIKEAAGTLVEEVVETVSSIVSGPASIDPRVVKSIEWIREGRDSGFLVKDLAAELELSESRFSHLFAEQVRVPVRRYLLWLRLRDALHMISSAETLTEAAHMAGFADSAHLSRTFRSALGIAPSDIVKDSKFTSFLS